MPFELRVQGIDEHDLLELQGAQGPFWVTCIGGKPELEDGFFYGDAKHQFCFYAKLNVIDEKRFDIDIFEASFGRFSGSTPHFIASDLDTIEKNIVELFRERKFFNLSKPAPESDKQDLQSILFTWGVRQ